MKNPRTNQTYIGLWVPVKLAAEIKTTASAIDSDMSKFIRSAVKDKLARTGRPRAQLAKEAA